MARLVVCALALLVTGSLATPVTKYKVADKTLARRQYDLNVLFYHINEPNHIPECRAISESWSLEKNLEHYGNVSAVKTYIQMLEHKWILPKGMPFSINEPTHNFEAVTLFHVLFSAKDYDTFYKTAVFFRDRINEHLFVYILNVVTLTRPDTQGIRLAPIYEIFPWYFFNGEVMTTAQRINIQGDKWIDYYPSTYKWDESVVIRWNDTLWPYYDTHNLPMTYYMNDKDLNALYYNFHVLQPSWLGGDDVPLIKDRRGEFFWFVHKQLVSRYYMERLSNGLGEISDLGHDIVKEGYNPGLLYPNGVAFPVRPNYFYLNQPNYVDDLQDIHDYERRIRDAIDQGYIVNENGDHISLRTPESIDVLGRLIEANVDSPNKNYHQDFISLWKKTLGNSHHSHTSHGHGHHGFFHHLIHHYLPLIVHSVLEHYMTAVRDPAFYMISKHTLGLFQNWHEHLPHYKPEELALPSVAIQKVETDKLMTYFENTYTNVTSGLYMNEHEAEKVHDDVSVLVQHVRLNHKAFQMRVHVKSEDARTVVVRFFLAPKYDSNGVEIPLHANTENFFQIDEFIHELPAGESVITRNSADNAFAVHDLPSFFNLTTEAWNTAEGHGYYMVEEPAAIEKWPHHLLLPKGRVGGMPFVLMVYISEYRAPKAPIGTGYDKTMSLGLGSGARYLTDDPLGFPVNRPLYIWQVEDVHNMAFHDVLIYHKHTPEIAIPHKD